MQRFMTLLLLATFISGCVSIDERKKTVMLNTATRHYESAIRWGDYATANTYRLQDSADAPATKVENLKHYRVTSYETLNTVLNADDTEAQVVVRIKYYDEERMREVTLTDHQIWKFDTEAGLWYLDSPLPAFH
jgi:PBP1b-binding outer membrane lipoprotein LpoB